MGEGTSKEDAAGKDDPRAQQIRRSSDAAGKDDPRAQRIRRVSGLWYNKHGEVRDYYSIISQTFLVGIFGLYITTAAANILDSFLVPLQGSTPDNYIMEGFLSHSWRTRYKESWRKYLREKETEVEREERIRRNQGDKKHNQQHSQRNDYKQHNQQHYQRKDEKQYYYQWNDSYSYSQGKREKPPSSRKNSPFSNHYSILGLDRWGTKPYTDNEIKAAFQMKAKEFHPDRNPGNTKFAEAKFKEIMAAYEALKLERNIK